MKTMITTLFAAAMMAAPAMAKEKCHGHFSYLMHDRMEKRTFNVTAMAWDNKTGAKIFMSDEGNWYPSGEISLSGDCSRSKEIVADELLTVKQVDNGKITMTREEMLGALKDVVTDGLKVKAQ